MSRDSYLIYSLSKERKRQVGETYQSWLAAVVNKILVESGIRGVIVGSRILSALKTKIISLHSAFKRASKSGGKSIKKLLNVWKVGPKYSLTIYYNEIELINLEKENNELRGEKRALEQSLVNESTKRMRVEEKLKSVTNLVKKNEKMYKQKFKQLVKKVAKINSNKKSRGPDKKKTFNEYSKQHKARVRKQLKEQCESTLSFLGHYNYVPSRVELYNQDTEEVEIFVFMDDSELNVTGEDEKEISQCEVDDMNMWLYIKDKFNISNEAWHEVAMKSKDPPCLNKMLKHMKGLNNKWNIQPTPGEAEGVQISFKESVVEQIRRLKAKGVLQAEEMIKIKLSGDGTNIGKRISVINITFTILNEKNLAMSEKGNYLLAVIRTSESYDTLANSLADLIEEMKNLEEIDVDNSTYYFEYFLGGDWKFLACVCGIGAANADYACIWCRCPRLERWNTEKHWSVLDPGSGARSLDEVRKYARSKKFNCKNKPLFSFIPLSHVVIDTLHLFLRISDNLIALLIRELKFSDAIEKRNTFANGFCRDKYKHMAGYETFLNSLGIPFHWYVGKETKQLEYRDLTGPEKVKLLKNVTISSLLPNSPNKQIIQEIWDDFSSIIEAIKHDFKAEDVKRFENKITAWLNKFLVVYQKKDVTPYMHALYAHVPEFLSLYTNIEYFTQQGMEKYNDITSKNFFRSSNHRGVSALKQIFLKRNRVQYLEAAGCARVKYEYTCSNCGDTGHTIKTCTAECKNCDNSTYCAHLVKVDGKYHPTCTISLNANEQQ